MRPLAVGQAPGKNHVPGMAPLHGRKGAGGRLASLMGVGDVSEVLDTVNIIDVFPGRAEQGDLFPLGPARESAERMNLSDRPLVILLGKRVADAFRVSGQPLTMATVQGVPVLLIPHPSGINRWYNEPANVSAARAALRSALGLE